MANVIYDWNPFQDNLNCNILKEVIKPASQSSLREFIPRAAPFFSRSAMVRITGSSTPLTLGVDYVFGHTFDRFINQYARNCFGSVILLKDFGTQPVEIDYSTIGGPFVLDEVAFAELVANIVNAPRTADWGDLVDVPTAFPPDPHDHPATQTYDYLELIAQMKSLLGAISDTSQGTTVKDMLEQHMAAALQQAHAASGADIGLGLTPDMAPALISDLQGNSANLLVTVYVMKEAFRLFANGSLVSGGGGGGQLPGGSGGITNINTSATLTASNQGLVIIDASVSSLVVALPASNTSLGVVDFILRRSDNTTNTLQITAAGSDKIKFHTHLNPSGYPFFVLMGSGDYWHLRSDGNGGWIPVSRYDGTPLGRQVMETTTAINPGGWGLPNGTLLSRTAFPWLWDHAQQSGMLTTEAAIVGMEGCWTSGDGSTTFRCPEIRGEFMRVLDEARGVEKDLFFANLTTGSNVVSGITFTGTTFGVGATVSGAGIPVGTVVSSINKAGGTITLSANATSAGTASITAIGRQAGSSQVGTAHNIDTGGSNAILGDKVSGVYDPGVARVAIGLDEGDVTKYGATAGNFAIQPTTGGGLAYNTEASWGVTRPRNIAYPGRIKLI